MESLLAGIVTKTTTDKNNSIRHICTRIGTREAKRRPGTMCSQIPLRYLSESSCVDTTTLPMIIASQENSRHSVHCL